MTMFAVAAGCVNRTMPKADLPEIDTTNPLLAEWNTPFQTPPFDLISVENYEPAFEDAMAVCRAELDAIINNPEKPTFYNTVVALERQGELLGRISSVFFNMLQCNTSDEIQAIAQRVQPKLVALENDANLNPVLFERVKSVYENPEFGLTAEDKVLLENTYKGFVRSGAALSDEDKELYRQYSAELSRLSLVFGQNALASTNAFSMNITDKSVVEELPDFVKQSMAEEAKSRGEKGWTLTLQYPSYLPFMMYSTNRDYKERLWMARSKVAYGGEWDNTSVVKDIVNLRLKVANLLGYETYADYVLENRMAENPTNVNSFLDELLTATKEYAVKDYEMVNKYANEHGFEGKLMPWDWTYWSEQYKNEVYSISDEIVKPYFELESVKKGVFLLANKLYGLNFTPREDIQVYHPEVTAYEVTDESGKMMAVLYLDFFPRASKRAGAWMTEFRGMKSVDGVETRPLVSLVMNFTKPTETTPSLLTFDEFETFLHEFGHALHGMLAEGTHGSLTGTSVYRDFVELPSQIMENWAVEKEYLDLWAVHYQTGEKMPEELINKIVEAQNYLAAYLNIRQLSFGISDMAWHSLKEPFEGDVVAFEVEAMAPTQITPVIEGTVMATSFSHIFAGGYAAGYYGYKWAEVLDADAFSLFKEKGIFNREVSNAFRKKLLSKGGTEHPMKLYVDFRGHKPETKALIDRMNLDKE